MAKPAIISIGKRRKAIARAIIKPGKGMIRINGKRIDVYEPKLARDRIMEPVLLLADEFKKYDISVNTKGGGGSGATDAVRLAISRSLVDFTKDDKIRSAFLNYDRSLLVADVRRKEMRKPNDSKARAKRQKSYR